MKRLAAIYVVTVALTLWLSGHFAPWVSVADSLVGIGLVIALWVKVQKETDERFFIYLTALIVAGAVAALLVNLDRPYIAVASTCAFLLASTVSFAVQDASRSRPAAIVAFALVDSLVFAPLAFGFFDPVIVGGQVVAKIVGAVAWTWVLRPWQPATDE